MDKIKYIHSESLEKISLWRGDWVELLVFIKHLWTYDHYFKVTEDNVYFLSTGGWSGNEQIIEALRRNILFWSLCWMESRRGGHYKFKIPTYVMEDED